MYYILCIWFDNSSPDCSTLARARSDKADHLYIFTIYKVQVVSKFCNLVQGTTVTFLLWRIYPSTPARWRHAALGLCGSAIGGCKLNNNTELYSIIDV